MGLMYVFPVSSDEEGFALRKDESLILKTYGLPYIFWFYALACIMIITFMFLAIREPVLKLVTLGDDVDSFMGYSLLAFIAFLPVLILGFFFYEKRIISKKNEIKLEYRIYGLKFFSETYTYKSKDSFEIDSFLSSPNVARKLDLPEAEGFKNKGYFVLWLKQENGKKTLIDRHSRKADLVKLKELITSDT